jgi:cobalt-zinc-cadmium efflux system membrane fusion protein
MSTATHNDRVATAPAPPGANPAHGRRGSRILQWLRHAIPTAIVIAVLGALATWGHQNEWTVPKFSELVGNEAPEGEQWCTDHNVPEDECIECRPDLLPRATNYGWCKEHGVAQCPLEHPDVAQLKTTPVITPDMFEQASRALLLKPRPENNSRCTLHQRRIQFASVEAVEKAGVDIAVVQERPIMEAVIANGEVVYDQTRMAHPSSRVSGTVWQVEKHVGDRVQKGEVLALIDAAEVGRAKGEFLQAMTQLRLSQANRERLKSIAKGAVAGRQLLEAETAHEEARIRLRSAQQALVNLGLPVRAEEFADLEIENISQQMHFLGLPVDYTSRLDPASTSSNLFPLRSPLDGVVIDRGHQIIEGDVVDTNTVLFSVADVSRLWLTLNVRQEDVQYVSLGQPVLFQSSDSKNAPEVQGFVAWISTAADDQTRTVNVRVELPNEDGRLRANTFGVGRIVLREEPSAVVVPSEAVHWDGTCHVVFVRDKNYFQPEAPKFFHVRSVRPGVKQDGMTEIIAGLLPGEVIASKNSTVLEAQLLKGNLGAGCCEVHTK